MGTTRVTVRERVSNWPDADTFVYHLPLGRLSSDEAEWVPLRCGGGIAFPGREKRPLKDVCRDCTEATS